MAEDICSEKYIYLIEKGERTPSVDLVRDFSDRLGVDLFEYYPYLSCADPVLVYRTINAFNKCRNTLDCDTLQKLTNEALKSADFHAKPWIYEIGLNRFYHLIFVEQKHEQAIDGIENFLRHIPKQYTKAAYSANYYILLSTSYQAAGDLDKAKHTVSLACKIIENKKSHRQYKTIIISVYLNLMTLAYYSQDYDQVVELGLWLNQFQIEHGSENRAHFTFFYLSFAYFQQGKRKTAAMWFRKGIRLMLLDKRPLALYYVASFEPFNFLIKDIKRDTAIFNDFQEMYKGDWRNFNI